MMSDVFTHEVLNALLFLLLGLEVVVLRFDLNGLFAAMLATPIVFAARLLAVSVPLLFLRGR